MADPSPESELNNKLTSIVKKLEVKAISSPQDASSEFIEELKKDSDLIPGKVSDLLNLLNGGNIPAPVLLQILTEIALMFPENQEINRSILYCMLNNSLFEDAASLAIEKPYLLKALAEANIDYQKLGQSTLDRLALSMAKSQIFIDDLILSVASASYDSESIPEILRLMLKNQMYENIISIYRRAPSLADFPENITTILQAMKELFPDEVINFLRGRDFSSIRNLDSQRILAKIASGTGDWEIFESVIKESLIMFPDDFMLQEIKASFLIDHGDKNQAFTILKDLFNRGALDDSRINQLIDLAKDLKLYDECLQIISGIDEDKKGPNIYSVAADCYLVTGRLQEAQNLVSLALKKYPENEEIKYLRYRVMRDMQRHNEAYEIALELVKTGSRIDDVISYLFNWLYSLGEYKDILDLYRKFEVESPINIHYIVASLISLKESDEALKLIQENRDVLYSPLVADSIFYNFRTDEEIADLERIIPEDADILNMVLRRLRGIFPEHMVPENISDYSRSRACCFIIAFPHFNSDSQEIDERVRTLLAGKNNAEILDLLETVHAIRMAGKSPGSILDSPKFLFPVATAMLNSGMIDQAENLILRSEHSDSDPFYSYLRHRIEFRRENYSGAKKFLSKSISKLDNLQFLQDAIIISIRTNDSDDLNKYILLIEEKSWTANLDLRIVHKELIDTGNWGLAESILQAMEKWGLKGHDYFSIKRDYLLASGNLKEAENASSEIFRIQNYTLDDLNEHIDILKRSGHESSIENFLDDIEAGGAPREAYLIHGDLLFRNDDFKGAIKEFEKASDLGIDLKGNRNYILSLIESGMDSKAESVMGDTSDPYILIRLYQKTHKIQESLALLSKYRSDAEKYEDLYRFAASKLWYNTEIREILYDIFREKGYLFLGKILARNLYDGGDSQGAIRIVKNLAKNYPQNLEIRKILIDLYVKSGMRDEAISMILDTLGHTSIEPDRIQLVRTLYQLYFQDRDYKAIVKFFEKNPDNTDGELLQYVVRSYIELEDFDTAERIISKHEGTTISGEVHGQLMEDLNFKKQFVETMFYVSKLFKSEYREGRTFDKKEAFYKAGIPVEKLPAVFTFLESRDFYFEINQEKYEIYSRDVIQKACKAVHLESIRQMTMNVIFNNLEKKDPVLARNIYLYIREQLETPRKARYRDARYLKLLKTALKEGLKPEPLHIAYGLKIGVAEALEVLAILNHMDTLESNGV